MSISFLQPTDCAGGKAFEVAKNGVRDCAFSSRRRFHFLRAEGSKERQAGAGDVLWRHSTSGNNTSKTLTVSDDSLIIKSAAIYVRGVCDSYAVFQTVR